MTDDEGRPRLHSLPAPRVADADVRPLLALGAGAGGTGRAPAAPLGGGDSLPYEGLVAVVATELCELVRVLHRVFRLEPVRRAMEQRTVDPAFVLLGTQDLEGLGQHLSFSTTPTPSGARAPRQIAAEVEASAAQLRQVSPHSDADLESLDTGLLAGLVESGTDATPRREDAAARAWATLMDLRSLHAELLGDRVPEPELSIGMALAHGVQIRDALSGRRWTLGETRAGDASTVLYAQVLTDRASRMTGAAAELYTHVVVLERHVRETYLAGLSYAAGAEFLRRADEDQDQLVQRLGEIADHEGAETWGGTYAVARAAARSRTFLRATDEDRAPDLFGPDEESERATFEI